MFSEETRAKQNGKQKPEQKNKKKYGNNNTKD